MVSIFVPHTTAGVTINENADPDVIRDMVEGLARLVPREAGYRHGEGNSDAHIKASLMGSHVLVPVENGRLRLGTWQSIYLAEFDGPRTRRVWVVPMARALAPRPDRDVSAPEPARSGAADLRPSWSGLSRISWPFPRTTPWVRARPAKPGTVSSWGIPAAPTTCIVGLKEHIGPFHWTPAEAFALGSRAGRLIGNPAGTGDSPALTGDASRGLPGDPRLEAAAPGGTRAGELTVISWALCHAKATKAANRRETSLPSEPWARARIFGQAGNSALHASLVDALAAGGYPAVAPSLLPEWGDAKSATYGRASTWSERHVAHVSGLGTFGLTGGLITERGQAVRFWVGDRQGHHPADTETLRRSFRPLPVLRPRNMWGLREAMPSGLGQQRGARQGSLRSSSSGDQGARSSRVRLRWLRLRSVSDRGALRIQDPQAASEPSLGVRLLVKIGAGSLVHAGAVLETARPGAVIGTAPRRKVCGHAFPPSSPSAWARSEPRSAKSASTIEPDSCTAPARRLRRRQIWRATRSSSAAR